MNRIELNRNGLICHNGQILQNDPLLFLGFRIAPADGYTLRSFFMMLEAYPVLSELNPFAVSCLEQYRSCPTNHCVCGGMDYLELGKTIEMTGFPGEPGVEIYQRFLGVGNGETMDIRPYGFDSLLDMPLKLGKLRHIVFGDKVNTFEFQAVYSLFELIDGILWALSFHNMPLECRIGAP